MRKCILIFCAICTWFLWGMTNTIICASIENVLKEKLGDEQKPKKSKKNKAQVIEFRYKDRDLVDVINEIAGKKGENVILPTGEDAIKSKLTIDISQKLTINEAWDILQTILDVAGYGIALNASMYQIEKKGEDLLRSPLRIFKEPSRIFIASPYEQIPDTDERIIYLAYFTNIQVPQKDSGGANIVQQLLSAYLSPDSAKKGFQFIPSSNGVMIVDKASNIRSLMKIFKELDKAGIKEYLEVMPLKNTSAVAIEKLFVGEGGILGQDKRRRYRLGKKRKSELRYFEKSTKVVAEPRTNSLVLLGTREAVEKIKDFIFRYIDVVIESGRSVLHRRRLDYLDCNKLRDVLRQVVGTGGEEQARPGISSAGPERFFTGVKIETDRPEEEASEGEKGKYKYSGTNSLLVAANNEDWEKIDELVGKLDKPVRQVIVEVLIVDLRMEDNRAIGGQTRNPALAPIFRLGREGRGVDAQAAQVAQVITQDCTECSQASQTIKSDLMQYKVKNSSNEEIDNPLWRGAAAGSALFTISDRDGKTWSVLKLLNLYNNAKILSHPYIVAINNKKATVTVGLEKILRGDASSSSGGGVETKSIPVTANIQVEIRPRIGGMINGANVVNLEVGLEIDEFQDATETDQEGTQPRFIRHMFTNANLKDGEILALGGLIRVEDTNSRRRAPILGRIPILGWFFKDRGEARIKNNLTVFIRTTVVDPKFRGGFNSYTRDYIRVAKKYSQEGGLFENLRDPITRWFFRSGVETSEMIDEFVEQHEKKVSLEELKIAQNKNDALKDAKSAIDSMGSSSVPKDAILVVDNKKNSNKCLDAKVSEDCVRGFDNSDELAQELQKISLAELTKKLEEPNKPVAVLLENTKNKENSSRDKLRELLQCEQNPLENSFVPIH